MSIAPQSFQFTDTASVAKTGQTLPIGPQASSASLPVTPASDVSNIEPAGTPITGALLPTGGVGLTGWLSAIYAKLTTSIAVTWSGQSVGISSIPALVSSSATIGNVNQSTTAAGFSKLTDGTTTVSVKASSNLPLATDTALTVTARDPVATGSLNFQTAPVIPLMITSAYPQYACIGSSIAIGGSAVIPVPVFRNLNRPSAALAQFMIGWIGVETVSLTAYVFSRKPTGGTLTDGVSASFAATDLVYLVTPPFLLSVSGMEAGSNKNFATQSLALPVNNLDIIPSLNLYVVLVTSLGVTTTAGDLFFSISGIQD